MENENRMVEVMLKRTGRDYTDSNFLEELFFDVLGDEREFLGRMEMSRYLRMANQYSASLENSFGTQSEVKLSISAEALRNMLASLEAQEIENPPILEESGNEMSETTAHAIANLLISDGEARGIGKAIENPPVDDNEVRESDLVGIVVPADYHEDLSHVVEDDIPGPELS